MLIATILDKETVQITPDVLCYSADFIDARIVTPVRSFAQYIHTGTQPILTDDQSAVVTKYYGSDIAQSLSKISSLAYYSDSNVFLQKILSVLEESADCQITSEPDKKIYLYDIQRQKVIRKLENKSLSGYQYRPVKGVYISKIGNIAIVQSDDDNFGIYLKSKFSFF